MYMIIFMYYPFDLTICVFIFFYLLQPLLDNSPARVPVNHGTTKYSKLENEIDSPNRQFLCDTLQQQNDMIRTQDEQLDMIGESIGTLKTVSRQINTELDEQAV